VCIISKYPKRIFGLTSARDHDKLVEHSIFQIVQFTGNELRTYIRVIPMRHVVREQKVGKHCGNRLYKG